MSEVSAPTVERAAKATEIVAVEVEVSLWSTDIFQNGVADACAKLGIPVVAYVYLEPILSIADYGTATHQLAVGCYPEKSRSQRIFQRVI